MVPQDLGAQPGHALHPKVEAGCRSASCSHSTSGTDSKVIRRDRVLRCLAPGKARPELHGASSTWGTRPRARGAASASGPQRSPGPLQGLARKAYERPAHRAGAERGIHTQTESNACHHVPSSFPILFRITGNRTPQSSGFRAENSSGVTQSGRTSIYRCLLNTQSQKAFGQEGLC